MSPTKRAYKYRFSPTDEQARILAHTFGCVRFVYNWALHTRSTAYNEQGKKLSYHDLSAMLPALKEQFPWLKDVSSVPVQQSLRYLDTAFKNFFKGRAKYPTFKKKQHAQSATYASNAFTWDGTALTLAKMETPLDIHLHRAFPQNSKPSSVTISKDGAGRYFVSLLVEEDIAQLPVVNKMVGLDLGLKSMVILSTGEAIGNPRFLRQDEKKLAKAQRRHARKKKGSRNRNKARVQVACVHARIVRENQVICVESLVAKNMVKNHCLAKSISDVGWGEFVRQLEYKAKWYGRTLVKIDRWYPSSKTCHTCKYVLEELDLEVRSWTCPQCRTVNDRDTNAALNILAEGLSVSACGGGVRPVRAKARRAIPSEAGNAHP
jgi:putative transposase